MINLFKILGFIFIINGELKSQESTYIGQIQYTQDILLTSGNYQEKNTIIVHFNKNGYIFSNFNKGIDTNQIVENTLSMIKPKFENDSFGLDRVRKQTLKQIREQLQSKGQSTSTLIDYSNSIAQKKGVVNNVNYCVIDTVGKIDWQLKEDTMTIDGLLCQKARGWFVGKHYNVWFAPSIPFTAGPLNMHGLPGIIVLAISEDNKNRYTMKSVAYPLEKSVEILNCSVGAKQISNFEFMQLQGKKIEAVKQRAEELKSNAEKRNH